MLLNLRAERVRQGLTQEDMANKIGIAEATYCRKEKGNAYFSFKEVLKILEILNCKFEDIFLQ